MPDFIAASYTSMTNLPFVDSWGDATLGSSASEVLNSLFMLAVVVGAMLATLVFIYGGIKIITAADNPQKRTGGKTYMKNAVMGLLMLLATWVVLSTINPQIVSLGLFSGVKQLESPDKSMQERLEQAVAVTEEQTGEKYTELYGKQMYCKHKSYFNRTSYDCYSDPEYCKSVNGGADCRAESRGLVDGDKYTYHKDVTSEQIIEQYKNQTHHLYCPTDVTCYKQFINCKDAFGAEKCTTQVPRNQNIPYSDGEWHIKNAGGKQPLGYVTQGLCEAVAKQQSTVSGATSCVR